MSVLELGTAPRFFTSLKILLSLRQQDGVGLACAFESVPAHTTQLKKGLQASSLAGLC